MDDPINSWEWAHSPYASSSAHLDDYTRQSARSSLLYKNAFIESLQGKQKCYFLHVTTALSTLLATGELRASGGCLVGSVYCTPLDRLDDGGFRAHNLGSYIYSQEVQECIKNRKSDAIVSPLIIEVESMDAHQAQGFNYLKIGRQHLQAYTALCQYIPSHVQVDFKHEIARNVIRSSSFWQLCLDVAHNKRVVDRVAFFKMLNTTIPVMPILGYFYFEAIIEYIMLHSRDNESVRREGQYEFNNWAYKKFIFQLAPQLLINFNLGIFSPTLNQLIKKVHVMNSMAVLHINVDNFLHSIMLRISTLVSSLLLSGVDSSIFSEKNMPFVELAERLPDLIGHCIDRRVRQLKELKDFSYKYDKYKAEQLWCYWNEKKIAFPFNGIIPKGEVGINPAANLKHGIYTGEVMMRGKDMYLVKGAKLPIKIVPEFLDASYAFMGIKIK